jgi:flagellar biosynthetic protein FliR
MNLTLWLVFARALGFFVRAPGISRQNVPPPLRAAFAFLLAAALAPALPHVMARDPAAAILVLGSEAFVGATFGLSATVVAEAASAAGRILDDLVGLRASVPQIGVAPAGLGGLWTLVFVTAFFGLGGIDAFVLAFAQTFSLVPPGEAMATQTLRRIGISSIVSFAALTVRLAMPAISIALCIQIGLAALTRVLPRFSHLSVAYPPAFAAVVLLAFVGLGMLRDLALGR